MQIAVHNKYLDFSKPKVMGILNVTPDSFFVGSRKQTEAEIADRTNEIVKEGGSIIDIGAFSTRPGSSVVTENEEIRRMRFGLEIVRREQPDAIVSIDTFRPSVARMAVEEYGADIINDVSEGRGYYNNEANDSKCASFDTVPSNVNAYDSNAEVSPIFNEVARLRVPYILMSLEPDLASTISIFRKKIAVLNAIGVRDIILDPGYGFKKEIIDGNFKLLARQKEIKEKFSLPLLVGISRKRMIWQLLNCTTEDSLNGTTALNVLALERGGDILRVHDVKAASQAVRIYSELCRCQESFSC